MRITIDASNVYCYNDDEGTDLRWKIPVAMIDDALRRFGVLLFTDG